MDNFNVFPDKRIAENGPVSKVFIDLGITSFQEACRYVHKLPYGYNSNSDDLMVLFKEKKGTCTTKHAVIGTLARELALPVHKNVGIYAMTEEIVSGTDTLMAEFLPRPGRRAQTLEGKHSLTPRPYQIKKPVGSLARIQQVEEGCFVLHLRFYKERFLHSLQNL